MCRAFDPTLYIVTDRNCLEGVSLLKAVEQAVEGGATMVQLREKHLPSRAFIEAADDIKHFLDGQGVPLIINDRLDVALAVDAAGLHVGQEDMPAVTARRLLGPDKVLGVSARTVAEAVRAERDGADYLGVGAVFPTGTKEDAVTVGPEELRRIIRAVDIPVVAIGGISEHNADQLVGLGLAGISVVSAVFAQADVRAAAERMKPLATAAARRT